VWRDVTVSEIERLEARAGGAEVTLRMDEEAFRGFYDRTARPLWLYLRRVSGDGHAADDLLQDTYYRFLRAGAAHESEAHRRNALFHIATNLLRDANRRRLARAPIGAFGPGGSFDATDVTEPRDRAGQTEQRTDVNRALSRLKPRERALLWLAYGHGSSHQEIAAALGVGTLSVKPLLFRARRKLAALLSPLKERS
jgi:RNA polymerase sigma-70 factor (ECF subfamily)